MKLDRQSSLEVLAVVGAIFCVSMMFVPIPEVLLDVFLAFDMAVAIFILGLTYTVREPLEFGNFPSLLLIVTLFRLGISISSTRLILTNGHAGAIIEAFGTFLVSGNYAIGIVIFLILMVFQLIVITNGSTRVSEVVARFTLDSLPGKQLAIDHDLSAGAITPDEARHRRQRLQQEVDFYGAMDGASKFVKGDATGALVIVGLNIVVGLFIAIVQRHMDVVQGLQTYTILTVGEGLVSQVPAILISTAMGVLITRHESQVNFGIDILAQFSGHPQTFAIVSIVIGAIGIIPGMPILPFLGLSGGSAYLAYWLSRRQKQKTAAEIPSTAAEPTATRDSYVSNLPEPLELEVGVELINLALPDKGGTLLEQLGRLRTHIAEDLGLFVPTVRVRDNLLLGQREYVIKIRGAQVGRGEIIPEALLAIPTPFTVERIEGVETLDPTFQQPAFWIAPERRQEAELKEYTIVQPTVVMTTHLSEVIRRNAADLLSRQKVRELIDGLKDSNPAAVDDLFANNIVSLADVHRVLQNLLRERVPITDLVGIVEALGFYSRYARTASGQIDTDQLTERVRQAISRTICLQYATSGIDRSVYVVALDTDLDRYLSQHIIPSEGILALSGQVHQRLVSAVEKTMKEVSANYEQTQPVLICSQPVRLPLRRLLDRSGGDDCAVISYPEMVPSSVVHWQIVKRLSIELDRVAEGAVPGG